MKKLLGLIGSIALSGTIASSVVGCGHNQWQPTSRERLIRLIAEAQGLVNRGEKGEEAVNALIQAMGLAQKIADDPLANEETIDLAIKDLAAAISVYQGSRSREVVEARDKLIDKIGEAWELVSRREKNREAVQMLFIAANNAQMVLAHDDATAEQLNKATEDLQKAIDKYNAST